MPEITEERAEQIYNHCWRDLKEQHDMAVSAYRGYSDESAKAIMQTSMITTLNIQELLQFAKFSMVQLEQLRESIEDVANEINRLANIIKTK